MNLNQLEYSLPEERIAHSPTEPRDNAKLLQLNKDTGQILHSHFFDLDTILSTNDVLVFNNTKVFPARLFAGKIEILLLQEKHPNIWTALHRGKVKIGQILNFGKIQATVIKKEEYEITIQFIEPREVVLSYIESDGKMPLPPYIHPSMTETDIRDKYQTVYATENGSVAAPTAGLHFTHELIQKLKVNGVQIEYVTLHVGAGTFLPIKHDEIEKHPMHSEYFSVEPETIARLNEAKLAGKRIISVGTTTTRVLETLSNENGVLRSTHLTSETDIFIFPPYKFKFVDSLITNFHLPHSTLLALVLAFVSTPNTGNTFTNFKESVIGKAYDEAIQNKYSFYSFGDGMIIS